jgi:hypothetical protein
MNDDYMSDEDRVLSNYTREEKNFYNKDIYDALLKKYPLKEDLTVYRGVNFKTRKDYFKFMKAFEKNGGYTTGRASGFSKSYETALDFSETTKTYYPTAQVVALESKRRKESEKLTGYCGIILKTTVAAGEVIDVMASDYAIEDEVLFRPNAVVKAEIEVNNTYRHKVSQPDFNMNEYIQKLENLKDPILEFLTINYPERLNNDSANHILKLAVGNIGKLKESRKENYKDDKYNELVYDGEYISVIKETRFKSLSRLTQDDTYEQYHFTSPVNILTFEKRGCFRPEQYEKIKAIANGILLETMDAHIQLGQKEKIVSLRQASNFAKFASKHVVEPYEGKMLKRLGKEYHEMNDDIRKVNDPKLSKEERNEVIEDYTTNIEALINQIGGEIIPNNTRKSKRLSGNNLK